ncbi:nucleoside hydrolase [Xylophilus ampelinus]|nr:nucleoside hydrolase [Xylophilus ampelinus]MCS4510445.1 nucleoside hydrolase [Xylophilus ampelinus]
MLTFSSCVAQADNGKRKIIIDQDALGPAGSNLKSVLMLLNAPNVDVLGITVSSGDGWRDENVASVLRLLEISGRTDIGVYPGAVFPLLNTAARSRRWQALYGPLVYEGAWSRNIPGKHPDTPFEVPAPPQGLPKIKASPIPASQFMVSMVQRYPGEVTIWSGGPMTNVAMAARLDENFARTAKELVFMGGSFSPHPSDNDFAEEYRLNPRLEFNMRFDPEAASLVLHEPWRKITQIPVDPSTKTLWATADIAEVARGGSALEKYIGKYDQSLPMWDEIAAAVWLNPQMVKHQTRMLVDVDTSFTAGYGNTLSWKIGAGPGLGEQPVHVITDVDISALVGMVKKSLSDRP